MNVTTPVSSGHAGGPPQVPPRAGQVRIKKSQKAMLDALGVSVPESKPPASYAVALGFLAAFVVLLPLIYGGLLAFLGWLAIWHFWQAFESLSYGPYFVFHLPMALLGALLVVFLIKPVFFRPRTTAGGVVTLQRSDEPLLFAAVEKLCAATGSKMPARIEVDCQPNAHARFLKPSDSIKTGGDLVLRIGLPLIAALSVRQLAGVIGHELGHFNQRRGMTCSYLIRRLTRFFALIVFQRDRIDQKLATLRYKRRASAQLLYYITLILVEPMRGVLWLMLLAGELLTCGVLRRMEFDADTVEAHLAGVDDFIQTSQQLLLLDLASRQARFDLAESWNQQRLADDLPRLIVANAKHLAERREDILKLVEGGKTRWFDTHPCHNDRNENVQRLGAAGLIGCVDPASGLFLGFDSLCNRATRSMYESLLGVEKLTEIKLVPAQELAAERAVLRANTKALTRFFCGHVVQGRPIFPDPYLVKDIPSADALREVKRAREKMQPQSRRIRAMARQYAESSMMLPVALAQLNLCQIFRSNPRTRPLAAKMQKLVNRHRPRKAESLAILQEFEESGRARLSCALRILSNATVGERIGAEVVAGRIDVKKMLDVCTVLEECVPTVRELLDTIPALRVLHVAYNAKQPHPPLVKQILGASNSIVKLLQELREKLGSFAFPFAHGNEGGVTLAEFIIKQLPNPSNPAETFAVADAAISRYHDVAFRALSILTSWAEKAEQAAHLEPIDEPVANEREGAEPAQTNRNTRWYWIGYGSRAVAGLMLVTGLVYLSINPPELPRMPWESASDQEYRFRPAAFSVTYQQPMPTINQPQIPAFMTGYQGRVISMRAGRPEVFMPQGFVPPSFNHSGFNPGGFHGGGFDHPTPQMPGITPPAWNAPQFAPATPRIITPPNPGPGFTAPRPFSPPNFPERMPQPYAPSGPPAFGPPGGGHR
jgi:Zn-dependent protease with chaperone function